MNDDAAPPIGVLDSGVGGLAVLRHIHRRLPRTDTIYVADQGHAPYGERAPEFIRERASAITTWLEAQGVEVIVLACNTATAAAIDRLRTDHPHLTFVGMEPAVKPAAGVTSSNVIGVLATAGTLSAERYQALAAAHAADISVVHRIGEGLAMAVEEGREAEPEVITRLSIHAEAFTAAGADVVVLGCTHYAFLADALRAAGAGGFDVIDPADAVARQVARVAPGASGGVARHRIVTTAPTPRPQRFMELLGRAVDLETAPI